MNITCDKQFEKELRAKGMTKSSLHCSEKEVLESIKEKIIEEIYYNGNLTQNSNVKMK